MKKTSSPTQSCSHLLLTVTALLFLSIPTNAQWKTHQIFNNGIRLNDSGALSLHPNIPFEIDEPNVVGGRFRVTTTGLVGIGVISPTEKLEVNGNIKATGKIIADGGIEMNGSEALHFSKEGNVGIGVADPKARLSFNNTYEPKISLYQSGKDMFGFATSNGKLEYHVADQNAFHVFYRDRTFTSDTKTELMRIGGSKGNVGIGVTVPTEKLQVAGNIKATGKIIADGGIEMNGSEALHFSKDGNVGIGVADPKARLSFNNTYEPKISLYQSGEDMFGFATSKHLLEYHVVDINAAHVFYRDRSPSHEVQKAELMRISGSGNVGIGVTAPTEKLQVAGNIKATGKIIADGGIEMNGFEALHFSKEGNVGIGVAEPTQKLEVDGKIKADGIRIENGLLSLHPNATFNIDEPNIVGGRFTIGKDGNVGIGVTAPTEKLQVAGNIKATGNLLLENDDDPDDPIPVFQVSTAEQLTFIGSEAYTKWTENNTNEDSELYKNKDKYSLWVSKGIVSEDYVMASVDAWADYVFDPGYKLRSLEELSHFVRTNKHLPNIPSEAEVKQEGYSLHELNRGFLKTIEELTLHTIAQEEKIKTLNAQLEQYEHLSDEVAQLKAALAQLQQDQD
ncbi:hypothetical protein [Ulvibacterium marinum]|uniref:hypothetical protein n=1 Tax=Ulvibacterium marinum TaxID=2419782 RepID=UPI0024955AEE|nr:hypothetical protein [Ulvibacterium marinum]